MNRFADGPAVGPWDDGSLPCAIEAAFPLNSCETAVSNAVPWSRTNPDGNNENPSEEMKDKAVRFWEDLLPLLKPKLTHIITAGQVAKEVLEKAIKKVLERAPNMSFRQLSVRLPSPQAMSRISGMFAVEDLLKRYPEVHQVVQRNPEWLQTYKEYSVFCLPCCQPVRSERWIGSEALLGGNSIQRGSFEPSLLDLGLALGLAIKPIMSDKNDYVKL